MPFPDFLETFSLSYLTFLLSYSHSKFLSWEAKLIARNTQEDVNVNVNMISAPVRGWPVLIASASIASVVPHGIKRVMIPSAMGEVS